MIDRDLVALMTYLQDLYGSRIPDLPDAMLDLWLEALARHDRDLVWRAVKRWARQHTYKPPSLDELLEQVEYVTDEDRRARLPSAPTSPLKLLAAAAAQAQAEAGPDTRLYARLQVGLLERVPRADWAAKCEAAAAYYAATRPALAAWLRQDAQKYAAWLPTAPAVPPAPDDQVLPRLGEAVTVPALPALGCAHEHVTTDGACGDCGELVETVVEA